MREAIDRILERIGDPGCVLEDHYQLGVRRAVYGSVAFGPEGDGIAEALRRVELKDIEGMPGPAKAELQVTVEALGELLILQTRATVIPPWDNE